MKSIILSELSVDEFKEILSESLKACNQTHISYSPEKETRYLTRKETAKILKISLPTLHEYTKSGFLKSYRLGKNIRYKRIDIENALLEIKHKKFRRSQDYSGP